jgi:hypothetical protein
MNRCKLQLTSENNGPPPTLSMPLIGLWPRTLEFEIDIQVLEFFSFFPLFDNLYLFLTFWCWKLKLGPGVLSVLSPSYPHPSAPTLYFNSWLQLSGLTPLSSDFPWNICNQLLQTAKSPSICAMHISLSCPISTSVLWQAVCNKRCIPVIHTCRGDSASSHQNGYYNPVRRQSVNHPSFSQTRESHLIRTDEQTTVPQGCTENFQDLE